MKILYAAGKRKGAALQLNRFLKSVSKTSCQIKIAAYRGMNCIQPIDWTLDALLNIITPDKLNFEKNHVLETYYEQVKYFSPDLIISDLEPFTSHVADALNITIWQVSSSLLYFALADKLALGVRKNYAYILEDMAFSHQIMQNFIFNADRRLVYSHLCDLTNVPRLKDNFEWVRPYHVIGEQSITAQHDITAIMLDNNKNFLQFLRKYSDTILFTHFLDATYPQIISKNIEDVSEYASNLKNCNYFVHQGFADFLADAFYNQQFSWLIPDFSDMESVVNSVITEYFELGKIIYDVSQDPLKDKSIYSQYNPNIGFLNDQLGIL